MSSNYPNIEIIIGATRFGSGQRPTSPVLNPATGEEIGQIPTATIDDIRSAGETAHKAFQSWKDTSPLDRSGILRRFAELLRENANEIAASLTADQGKPLPEAVGEVRSAADFTDWTAEEARRIYGRVIPPRLTGVHQYVVREPVGACLAITPWNFPLSQAVRKVANALASGCTLVLKGPGEAPSAIMAMANLLREAGLPDGCLNVLWGDPAQISETLIALPEIRKITFTGSVPVGKHLAALAGQYMKRATMELGGHAPVLVFDDTDAAAAARALSTNKLRNAGQICIAPTRFYVQNAVYDEFVTTMVDSFSNVKVGNGADAETQMGPLCHAGRVNAMDRLVSDARSGGGNVLTGGNRLGNEGYFYTPTVVEAATDDILLMREEPFGPIAVVTRFNETDEVLTRANSLPFGLASYVFTNSVERADKASARLAAGMVSVNHFGLALAETPLGGINDSGYGSEGGTETFEGYLNTKFVSRSAILR